jgi:hypothetical protein
MHGFIVVFEGGFTPPGATTVSWPVPLQVLQVPVPLHDEQAAMAISPRLDQEDWNPIVRKCLDAQASN